MRRSVLAIVLLIAALPSVAQSADGGQVLAGYGASDATWHVGAGSGQYSEKDPNAARIAAGDEADPFNHGVSQRPSYGVQSRLSYRTIVVQGSNGERLAFVKSDSYLAQDHLIRRAAQILEAKGTSGVHYDDIMLMASHNHSSPYYMSPSWGVWLFQDAFDIRAFEYHARQMALSIENAAAALRPARMGATTVTHKIYKGNIAGATLGNDGTPAGYPDSHADFGVTVVRFDDVSSNEPIAVLVNHGQHPESLDDYDLITADFLGPLERMIERDTGAPVVFGQGDVGSAEGPYFRGNNDVLEDGVIRAWAHVGHSQTERGARYLADDIVDAWEQIATGDVPVPFSDDFPVAAGNAFVPGPASHPYPSVSNCRTEPTSEGNPGSPILGLPDCERAQGSNDDNSQTWQDIKSHGLHPPEHYDAPAFGAVQENMRIKLQAFRMGEVIFASCSCEAQMDLILNFESRANKAQGDIFDGYEYPCTQKADTTWDCQAGSNLQQTVNISDAKHARMIAQIHNDADGWDAAEYAVEANGEPLDPADIKGNFTKEELSAEFGYALPVGVGHAGDYNGYVVSYREYMIRDHYRKALTAWGPHTADYMVTRMVGLAEELKGGPALPDDILEPVAIADEARQVAASLALGQASSAAYEAWVASLPSDVGPAAALEQPANVTRFDAATFTWRGGSNATDNPVASVERLVNGDWVAFADHSGEVQTKVRFPEGAEGVAGTYAGQQEWRWSANFEAFDAFPRTVVPGGQTPAGTYRFVVEGQMRDGLDNEPYNLTSEPFTVSPWTGITVSDARRDGDGSVSFLVDPITYPRTYSSPFRFIKDDGNPVLCKTCSFRPWAGKGTVAKATVHVERAGGGSDDVPAVLSGGRWVAATALGAGDVPTIRPGDIVDDFGEINGAGLTF